jgi:hypothetical protein
MAPHPAEDTKTIPDGKMILASPLFSHVSGRIHKPLYNWY